MNGLIRLIGVWLFYIWILLSFVWLYFRQVQQIFDDIRVPIPDCGSDHSPLEWEGVLPFQIAKVGVAYPEKFSRFFLVNQFRKYIRDHLSFLRQMAEICHQFIEFRLRNQTAFHKRVQQPTDQFYGHKCDR